ncbi:hypothetical protein [Paenibacillus sp. FSL H3-0333]|uniref:hypothetical protein n=1 Tax=Paenibacillus sp. FSL H3-0333 TaxID=2921373 RepID=UPI0030F7A47F
MITINYCKEGTPIPDYDAEEWLESWLTFKDDQVYNVSTENIVSWVRVYLAEEKLSTQDVRLQFDGKNIEINDYAVITNWPDGFCDFSEETAFRIIRATRKRRANKM